MRAIIILVSSALGFASAFACDPGDDRDTLERAVLCQDGDDEVLFEAAEFAATSVVEGLRAGSDVIQLDTCRLAETGGASAADGPRAGTGLDLAAPAPPPVFGCVAIPVCCSGKAVLVCDPK